MAPAAPEVCRVAEAIRRACVDDALGCRDVGAVRGESASARSMRAGCREFGTPGGSSGISVYESLFVGGAARGARR